MNDQIKYCYIHQNKILTTKFCLYILKMTFQFGDTQVLNIFVRAGPNGSRANLTHQREDVSMQL